MISSKEAREEEDLAFDSFIHPTPWKGLILLLKGSIENPDFLRFPWFRMSVLLHLFFLLQFYCCAIIGSEVEPTDIQIEPDQGYVASPNQRFLGEDMNPYICEWNDVISMYNIDFSTLSFGRKRKTPYGFEMDSGTLCVSKKGNLGDRKTFCISSEANGQSRHSKASLNINATHETSIPMCADLLPTVVVNEFDLLVSTATCSDYIDNSRHISCTSSNINCPRKEAVAHQHLMDHVCVQPEKAFVLSECPLQKKVVDKVNCSKKQQAQANDQKMCMVQTDVVKAPEKAKEGIKGTMKWAKEKTKKGTKQQRESMLKAEEESAAKILARAQELCDEHKVVHVSICCSK
ncbi:hypothetical protein Tco_0938541 [Tanacetum coccineum]|uniref:Uncharacterized protein n=1 Tax=Tanacetum coccineum TaxID=301880 RepID=A0ABQ5DHG7_9ASTR